MRHNLLKSVFTARTGQSHLIFGLSLFFLLVVPGLIRAEDDLPKWLLTTKINGDFRYRHEGVDRENASAVYRNRIRYRLGIQTQVNDYVVVGARFATGKFDPRSSNQDLEDGLAPKFIALDRAYAEMTREAWTLTAGKFANPQVATDLQWDSDINFEGGMAKWSKGETTKTTISGGAVWLEPYKASHGAGIWTGQVVLSGVAGDAKWQAAAGFYSYVLGGMSAESGFGNALDNNGSYVHDYEILDINVGVTLPGMKKSKWIVTLNPVLNTALSEDNTGWLAMLQWKGKVLGHSTSWSYDYRTLEAEAAFAAFVDSEAAGGRTDQRGHRLMADVGVMDNVSVGGTAIFSTLASSGDGDWYQRWLVDCLVKF